MSSAPVLPPLDCALLFYERVNFHMQNNPTLPIFVYADVQASDHHTTEITFLEFGRAVHRIFVPDVEAMEDKLSCLSLTATPFYSTPFLLG
jgi:hypothetical protein